MSLGREMLRQARATMTELGRFEERAVAAERDAPGVSADEAAAGTRQAREQVREIRGAVQQMIARGVDPTVVEQARHALNAHNENLAIRARRNGRPEVVLRVGEDEQTIRWNSDERALAQVLNGIQGGHTPSRILETLRESRECPASFRERYEESAQYREWRAREMRRKREELERQLRARSRSRGPRGLGREL